MEKTNLEHLTDAELEEKLKEIKLMYIKTYRLIEGKQEHASYRKNLRKERARIETEKSRRRQLLLNNVERRSR